MQRIIGALLLAAVTLVACAESGPAAAMKTRTLSLTVPTPNPCWKVEMQAVYRAVDALLVVSQMIPPAPGMACAQVISAATARAEAELPDLPVHYLLRGKTWGWGEDAGFEAIGSSEALEQRLSGAELLIRLPESNSQPGPDKPVL